jgi:hypothetical protein
VRFEMEELLEWAIDHGYFDDPRSVRGTWHPMTAEEEAPTMTDNPFGLPTNLYYIDVPHTGVVSEDLDLFVTAWTPTDAVALWIKFYELEFNDLFCRDYDFASVTKERLASVGGVVLGGAKRVGDKWVTGEPFDIDQDEGLAGEPEDWYRWVAINLRLYDRPEWAKLERDIRRLPHHGGTIWMMSIRIEGYTFDIFGIPELWMTGVKNAGMKRTPDIRTRAIGPNWGCRIHVSEHIARTTIDRLRQEYGITAKTWSDQSNRNRSALCDDT